jgi:DhnA family fructose-bisphosphate aldolase class Ia
MLKIKVPLSVPRSKKSEYEKNYRELTAGSGQLLLIAGDQKVEHLNDDFVGAGIDAADASPRHLFEIAAASSGGALATHLGFIARYGADYPKIPYIIKINGKSNIGTSEEKDSSKPWWKVEDIVKFKKDSGLKIAAIGYTLYLGGKYEAKMLKEAARATFAAHQAGLLSIIWMYPRGKGINEENIHTIAGGAGMAGALDADFVKIKYPYSGKDKLASAKKFKEAVLAAGETKVICVGGDKRPEKELLEFLKLQIEVSGAKGLAVGRNLHQRSLKEATELTKKIGKIIHSIN